jgi:lysophospholipase L1-like esterase
MGRTGNRRGWGARRGRPTAILALALLTLAGSDPAAAGDPEPVCRVPRGAHATRVACLGDSNTQSDWQIGRPDGFPTEQGWCERLAAAVTTVNCGWGGATASPNATGAPYFQGQGQLDEALADPLVDFVILAWGTNDVGFALNNPSHLLLDDPTPAAIADVIAELAVAAESAGARVLVASSPHRVPPTDDQYSPGPPAFNDTIDELNAEIFLRFPAATIVDFTTGFGPDDFLSDGLHVNSAGMAKRADAALEGIARVVPEPGGALLPVSALLTLSGLRRTRRRISCCQLSRHLYNPSLLRKEKRIAWPPGARLVSSARPETRD